MLFRLEAVLKSIPDKPFVTLPEEHRGEVLREVAEKNTDELSRTLQYYKDMVSYQDTAILQGHGELPGHSVLQGHGESPGRSVLQRHGELPGHSVLQGMVSYQETAVLQGHGEIPAYWCISRTL